MNVPETFWISWALFKRGLGLVYFIAFLTALNQFKPLLGEQGLLPVPLFIRMVPFRASPSLFYFFPKDSAFALAAWIGILLSVLALSGYSEQWGLWISIAVWGLLWVIYLSFVNVGQTFYAFGWESILLEAGFYAIFLGSQDTSPPKLVLWLIRWELFRVMFGAGLIKMRGDPCRHNLSCLDYHYETQPMPNPLSWYFHWAPEWTHRAGVLVNHGAELLAPFGYFFTGAVGALAGLSVILFQGLIMLSGNLSFLNLLTLVLAIPTISDRYLLFLNQLLNIEVTITGPPAFLYQGAVWSVTALVAIMSIRPIGNMLSPRQIMNTNYNPLHLVGTYGAFGGITRVRREVVIEGTADAALTPATVWKEYEFKGKPGDPHRRPPQIAPYHLRLDWLMWFAALSGYGDHPWFVHLMEKLLRNDPAMLGLFKSNPFSASPPRYVRAELYEYHFATPAERHASGLWWTRRRVGHYFPPVSLQSPDFRRVLKSEGWT